MIKLKDKIVEIKEVVTYKSHNVKANGSVDLIFTAMYDQLTKSMELLQLLNNDVSIVCKKSGSKPFDLGLFRIKKVNIDGDGESTLMFNSLNSYVKMDNLNDLVITEPFQIKMSAVVEMEGGE